MHGRIGVERLDQREQLGLGRVGRQIVLDRMEAARLGRPALARDVSLARRILADEHDRETGRQPMSHERARLPGDAGEDVFGDRRAVEHEGGLSRHAPGLHSGRKT